MIRTSFVLTIIAAAVACSAHAQTAAGIRSVDFKNFTYSPFCAGDKPERVTVKNGEYSYEKQEADYVDRMFFQVFSINYGDATGDGKDEAVVLTVCSTGGTGNFSEGFVYTMRAGKPVLLARIPGGDRGYGGLRGAGVQDGLIVVDSNDVGDTGAACCPDFIVTTRYRLQGGKLVRSGQAERRPIYPAQRVTFARGASGATLRLLLPAGEGKRLIVGARAGQILSVSTDSESVDLRLLEDAQITQDVGGFSARLPKSGDYTIQLSNFESRPLPVTVNIKIR
ncbi:MAG: hypothetical protein ACK4S4_14220 [Pyrinomonadaceae bacterium]